MRRRGSRPYPLSAAPRRTGADRSRATHGGASDQGSAVPGGQEPRQLRLRRDSFAQQDPRPGTRPFRVREGMSIFPLAALLEGGEPVPDDGPIDSIGVAIDSAAGEGGIEHDGTAAIIYGLRQPRVSAAGFEGGQVVILDW